MFQNIVMVIVNIHFHLVRIFSSKRIFYNNPKQGDLVVFKTPVDNRTDYIKRLLVLPGDEIQFIEWRIYLLMIKKLKEIK